MIRTLRMTCFSLVLKSELKDAGNYTCQDLESGETTNCQVTVKKAPIRLIKGLPETLVVPQGKIVS